MPFAKANILQTLQISQQLRIQAYAEESYAVWKATELEELDTARGIKRTMDELYPDSAPHNLDEVYDRR